jgi:DNA-binding transcriptional ArsR family regulator
LEKVYIFDTAMTEGPNIAKFISLIADVARSQMLSTLMGGQTLSASDLADAAEISRSTASSHLAQLEDAGFLHRTQQGRHSYFRLAGEHVAAMIEQLLDMAARTGSFPLVTGPWDGALREARVCYDHLAGDRAVALFERLLSSQALAHVGAKLTLGPQAQAVLEPLGIDCASIMRVRHVPCRSCMDWSVQRPHLSGELGRVILELAFAKDWIRRVQRSRAIQFTPTGAVQWAAIGARSTGVVSDAMILNPSGTYPAGVVARNG